MKKFNKGFIQIPLLIVIIVSVLTLSGTGIVLYKKGKLPFITKKDNVTQFTSTSSPTSTQKPQLKEDNVTRPTSISSQIPTKKAQSEVLGVSELEGKTEEALMPIQTQNSFINDVPSSIPESPLTVSQENTTATQQQTYSIIPLGDISSFPERERTLWTNAYNEFLRTHNLQYMNYDQQNEHLLKIVEKYYPQYKHELEQEIQLHQDYLNKLQELNNNEQETQSNPEIETKLDELRQTLEQIQNQPVAMNVIEGKKQRAHQDWINDNQEVYAQILNNNYYTSQLNTILAAYGL